MKLFRIKNNYRAVDQETGEVRKFKEEYLVTAENYTDAESFIVEYNSINDLNKFVPAEYEIVKEKFTDGDIYINDVFSCENGPGHSLISGLTELFFENDTDRLFGITVKYFGDKESKQKDYTVTYYIPGNNMENAVKYFNTKIVEKNADRMITKTTADNMVSLFVTPEIYGYLNDKYTAYGL